jgi:hypothetical protein
LRRKKKTLLLKLLHKWQPLKNKNAVGMNTNINFNSR